VTGGASGACPCIIPSDEHATVREERMIFPPSLVLGLRNFVKLVHPTKKKMAPSSGARSNLPHQSLQNR
jgi:hypothetical protein